MNRLSSQIKFFPGLVLCSLVMCLFSSAFLNTEGKEILRPTHSAQQYDFQQYGYAVRGFTGDQENIIAQTLDAYAQALGGPAKLRSLILAANDGQLGTITYAPDQVGAYSNVLLSPTVFSVKKSLAANYSTYTTTDETMHARIVIGHEIGHVLLDSITHRTGIDWSNAYRLRVAHDWTEGRDPRSPEEEAVTNLSLKIQSMNYYYDFASGTREENSKIVYQIDAWVASVLKVLRKM
jgi:hypothetical protein